MDDHFFHIFVWVYNFTIFQYMWIKKQRMRRTIREDEQYTLRYTIPFDKHKIV